jgi:Chaperone of endosialidase
MPSPGAARPHAAAGAARHAGGHRAGGRGGGRRSDLRLKHDIVQVGHLANGINLYRFVYNGGHVAYVGVIAQQARDVVPAAVTRGADGYLRVDYDKLGLKFQSYRQWLQNGEYE